MTIDQIKTAADTNIRAKTADNSVTRDEVADLFDNLADEQRDRGLYGVDTTAGLAAVSGANYRKVSVADTGIFEWSSTGTANGTTIFAASGGGVWILKMAVKNNQIVTFNQQVPFTKMYSYAASHSITANLTFTPLSTGAIPGSVTLFKVIADGTHTIAFTGITEVNISSGYDNRNGIENYLAFFYDGYDYFVNIYQKQNAQPIDLVSPLIQSAVVNSTNASRIVLTYNESLNTNSIPSVGDFSVSGGKTISSITIQGSTVHVNVNTPYSVGDTITISYTAGTNKIEDISGNDAINLSNYSVSNNLSGSEEGLIFAGFTGTLSQTGTVLNSVSGTYADNLAKATKRLVGDGYIQFDWNDTSDKDIVFGLNSVDANANYSDMEVFIWASGGTEYYTGPSILGSGITPMAGDKVRIRRSGSDFILEYKRSGGSWQAFTENVTYQSASDMYITVSGTTSGKLSNPVGFNLI